MVMLAIEAAMSITYILRERFCSSGMGSTPVSHVFACRRKVSRKQALVFVQLSSKVL